MDWGRLATVHGECHIHQPVGMTAEDWHAVRLLLYASGRAEVVLSDGSGLIVHPGGERVSYFRQDGARQRLLASCAPWRCGLKGRDEVEGVPCIAERSDDVRAKVSSALVLRNRFCPRPVVRPGLPGQWACRYQRLSRAVWPSASSSGACHDSTVAFVKDKSACVTSCGAVSVVSLDSTASLVLAPHGRTYAVEWWCPLEGPCNAIGGIAGTEGPELDGTARTEGSRLFVAGGAAVSLLHKHVLLSQCHAVADLPPAAWAYPLLLALGAQREKVEEGNVGNLAHLDAQLSIVAAALRGQLEAGCIHELGEPGDVSAPLPVTVDFCDGIAAIDYWSGDEASPASALGIAGEGPVVLAWTPEATTWLHLIGGMSGEATVDSSGNSGEGRVFVSSHRGRFWTVFGPDGNEQEVAFAEVLPADSVGAALFSHHVFDALKWLRHNYAEIAVAPASSSKARPSNTAGQVSQLAGWIVENEHFESGVGRLSVFRPTGSLAPSSSRRLVRVLFEDSARLEFIARDLDPQGLPLMPSAGDTFRLLDSCGKILKRSFGEPLACEWYSHAVQGLLRHLASDPAEEHRVAVASAALAEGERRRGNVLLQLHGFSAGTAAMSGRCSVDALPTPLTIDEVLKQSRLACQVIEGALQGECVIRSGGG